MFLLEYIKNPRKVGAVAASSRYLADAMLDDVDFENADCIVEYGPGTGAFTEKILARAKESTTIILIEINKQFYKGLKKLYGYKKNVIILNKSAEYIKDILEKYSINRVDYIISGLPFASLPKNVSNKILADTGNIIRSGGEFITFQYTLFKENYIKSFFDRVKHKRIIRNFPPAYVLRCKGDKYESENISSR